MSFCLGCPLGQTCLGAAMETLYAENQVGEEVCADESHISCLWPYPVGNSIPSSSPIHPVSLCSLQNDQECMQGMGKGCHIFQYISFIFNGSMHMHSWGVVTQLLHTMQKMCHNIDKNHMDWDVINPSHLTSPAQSCCYFPPGKPMGGHQRIDTN